MVDQVGRNTYGHDNIKVYRWDGPFNARCKVILGSFCSIGGNIEIITNGNHKYNRVSTYPFAERGWTPMNQESISAYGNGDVTIGNDVWIGMNSRINSGITIGDGSIIAADSLITRNVEPYSIVGGNPAKLIKYRFTPETRNKLLLIKWWEWKDERIREALPLLLKDDQCEAFIEKYGN